MGQYVSKAQLQTVLNKTKEYIEKVGEKKDGVLNMIWNTTGVLASGENHANYAQLSPNLSGDIYVFICENESTMLMDKLSAGNWNKGVQPKRLWIGIDDSTKKVSYANATSSSFSFSVALVTIQ